MTDAEQLALIRRIVQIQVDNQNDEDGDRHLADPYLALEAIETVLDGDPATVRALGNGALRQYLEVPS